MTSWLFRCMWMILYLVARLTLWLQGLQRRWVWWENCSFPSGFRSSRLRREHLCIKPSTWRHHQEVQDGGLQVPLDTNEYNYDARCSRGRWAYGLEGVSEHARLPLVLDDDEVRHTIHYVFVRSFSSIAEDFTLAGHQQIFRYLRYTPALGL
jgi:hypothetical protein